MESNSCDILLIRKKVKQAQMLVLTAKSRSIENIRLEILKTINTEGELINGCCMIADGSRDRHFLTT